MRSMYERMLAELDEREPVLPEFQTTLDEDGNLQERFRLNSQLDPRALQMLRREGLREAGELSPFSRLALEQLRKDEARSMDSVQSQVESMRANQLARMGSMGGYSRGAQERLNRSSFRDMLRQKQNNRSNFDNQRMDILKTNEQNRLNSLNNLQNFEMGNANYLSNLDRTNKGNTLTDFQNRNNYQMDKFREDQKKWASERNAIATERAASRSAPRRKLFGLF